MPLSTFRPDALRGYRLFESFDLDETRERISQVMQPHALVPSGNARGRSHMDFVTIGGLGLGTIGFGDAMRVDVEAVSDYYLLMFCVAGHAEVLTQGQLLNVDSQRGVLCAPGQPFVATLSADCEQFILRINPETLAAGTGMPHPDFPSDVSVTSPALDGWLQQLQLVANSPALLTSARSHPRVAQQLESLLIDLLATGHASGADRAQRTSLSAEASVVSPTASLAVSRFDSAFGPRFGLCSGRRPSAAPGIVKRAEDFIQAHCNDVASLGDITTAVGVSATTLREAFQQFRGVTPMQYVRQLRLDRARERLLHCLNPNDMRIADLALDCGFTHLGRFALAYRERFGESPSQTLRKR